MDGNNAVPPIYITKYNRFVDNILERINHVLQKSYDPVNVRLHSNNKKNGTTSSSSKKKNGNKKKNSSVRRPTTVKRKPHTTGRESLSNNTTVHDETLKTSVVAVSEQLKDYQQTITATMESTKLQTNAPTSTVKPTLSSRARPPQKKKQPQKTGNKTNNKTKSSRPPTRATLYGLASIKRDGDVTVNMMSSHTTVKSRFTLGPLMLKVERELGRGAKKDIRSAVATTTEMSGKLNLRIMNGGAATLHSIRVLQPKQVRVESADNHDKTREFIWRRSSHIAHLVSQKLTRAAKSMLQPPPTVVKS